MNSMQFEFDAVCEHLVKQGKQALTDMGSCVYRAEDGSKCAVGCRIPDEVYRPGMEGCHVAQLVEREYMKDLSEIKEYLQLFRELQGVHDSDSTWKSGAISLKESLRSVANSFNLTYPACIS